MSSIFDKIIDRRGSGSNKWESYNADVLPLWVADMDFAVPKDIENELVARVKHGVFGYALGEAPTLLDAICERTDRLYNWKVLPEEIVFFPGLTSALNAICRAFGKYGDGVVVQPPIYYPFLTAIKNQGRQIRHAPLKRKDKHECVSYEIDFGVLERAITTRTNLFLLCNPHNPIGKLSSTKVLERIAEFCERNDLIICSDEIHCELLLDQKRHHRPTATLSPKIAARCITLMAPSKTFNLAGLSCGYAIIQNPALMEQVRKATAGIIPNVNVMGFAGAIAAYRYGTEWLNELLPYLSSNRDHVIQYLSEYMPSIRTTRPEATYLMWLDCTDSSIPGNPHEFFLKEAKVALNDGVMFGPGGQGFVRLNIACPRATLSEALQRMHSALDTL